MSSKIIAGTTAGTALNMSADTTGILEFQTGSTPTTAVTITTAQNVGIGTTSPAAKVEITGGGNSGREVIAFNGTNATDLYTTYRYNTSTLLGYIGNGAGTITSASSSDFGIRSQNALAFATGGATERMRIDASGNLLVAGTNNFGLITTDVGANTFSSAQYPSSLTHTTTNNSGRPAITVASKGTGQDSALRIVVSSDNGSTFNGWNIGVNTETGSDTLSWTYNSGQSTRVFSSGTVKMRLTTGGGLSTTTGSLGTISDIRMKKDVTDATTKLDELMQLRVVNYVLLDDPEKRKMLGFVAQEIEQVFPALVEEFDVRDQETKELVMKQKSVKTTVLIPMLVKAIQEQQTMIEELKTKVAALEAK